MISNNINNQSTLVTGGAGFIGSHVCETLIKRNERVVCYDSLHDYYDPNLKRRNIIELFKSEAFSFVQDDVLNKDRLKEVISGYGVFKIIHLAARAGVRPSLLEPQTYEQVNVGGTLNVLDAARDLGINGVVLASSSSVYGDNCKVPFQESDSVNNPISPYAASKRSMEIHAGVYHRLYKMNIACLRFFTVYGPRQRPDMAIAKFFEQITSGAPIDMYGDGSSRRDYTYISDIVAGVIAASDNIGGMGYEIINLGNSDTISLRDLIEYIGRTVGCTPIINHLPAQPGDVPVTYADISKAASLLNYFPKVLLEDGLRYYADWKGNPPSEEKIYTENMGALHGQ